MIRVIEVKPDGRALIDTEGLYRIRLEPGGEIVDEFCTAKEAEYIIRLWDELEPDAGATAIPYSSAQRS